MLEQKERNKQLYVKIEILDNKKNKRQKDVRPPQQLDRRSHKPIHRQRIQLSEGPFRPQPSSGKEEIEQKKKRDNKDETVIGNLLSQTITLIQNQFDH